MESLRGNVSARMIGMEGTRSSTHARWLGLALVALFVAEMVVVTACFDRRTTADASRQWLATVPRLGVAGLTALLVVGAGGMPGRKDLLEPFGESSQSRSWWVFGLGHLAAFGLFALLTNRLFTGGPGVTLYTFGLYAGWGLAGIASLVLWCAAAARSELLRLLRHHVRTLAAAGMIGVLAWSLGSIANWAWRPLSRGTLDIAHALLTVVTKKTIYRPDELIVGTEPFQVLVEARCSGYEGIGLAFAFLSLYLYLFRAQLRFPRALFIVPIGVLIVWLVNAVRITALILVGTWISPDVAMEGFHSQAGWLAFCAISLGLVYVLQSASFFRRSGAAVERPAGHDATTVYLVPFLTLVALSMVSAAFSSGFDVFYPVRVLAVGAVLWAFRRGYERIEWTCSWHAVATGVVAFALWMALEPVMSGGGSGSGLQAGLGSLPTVGAVGWLGFRVIGAVVTVPIAEELAFRGYLARILAGDDFENLPARSQNWLSLLVSSALFGALHPGRWASGMAAGLLYAVALDRRGRVADAIVAHATTNALIATYVLTTGSWSLWA